MQAADVIPDTHWSLMRTFRTHDADLSQSSSSMTANGFMLERATTHAIMDINPVVFARMSEVLSASEFIAHVDVDD